MNRLCHFGHWSHGSICLATTTHGHRDVKDSMFSMEIIYIKQGEGRGWEFG